MTVQWAFDKGRLVSRKEEVRARRREDAERWQRRIELSPVGVPVLPTTRPIDLIQQVACWHGVSATAITGPTRGSNRVCAARFDAVVALRFNCKIAGRQISTTAIGRYLHHDHSTVLHALRMRGL